MVAPNQDTRKEVIQAWDMDNSYEDQRHHKDPKEFVSLDQLAELGVLGWKLDADKHETDEELKKIHEECGYSYKDNIEICPDNLLKCDEKIKTFLEEHLHTDEEIHYCLAGSGKTSAMRLFVGDPIWTPFNCPLDHLHARKEYLKAFVHKEVGNHTVDAAA
uniref:acireductone dioxygenase (Fe(2+)-requiring) n=1 Tax=Manihot esculenta TaxID=3983 RepID=A0A2C9UDG1_MANES